MVKLSVLNECESAPLPKATGLRWKEYREDESCCFWEAAKGGCRYCIQLIGEHASELEPNGRMLFDIDVFVTDASGRTETFSIDETADAWRAVVLAKGLAELHAKQQRRRNKTG